MSWRPARRATCSRAPGCRTTSPCIRATRRTSRRSTNCATTAAPSRRTICTKAGRTTSTGIPNWSPDRLFRFAAAAEEFHALQRRHVLLAEGDLTRRNRIRHLRGDLRVLRDGAGGHQRERDEHRVVHAEALLRIERIKARMMRELRLDIREGLVRLLGRLI